MARESHLPRVTIADVAREARTSTASVSYALNGRPGVSEETRGRVLAVAARLGWVPAGAARALAGGGAATIGLVLTKNPRDIAVESFYMRFIAGVEAALAERSVGLLLEIAGSAGEGGETIRRWWASRRVDGVLLTDVVPEDPRIELVKRLEVPAVVVGNPRVAGGLTSVWTDDAVAVREAVAYLAAAGHRRIVRFSAPAALAYTTIRDAAFGEAARAACLEHAIVRTDLSVEDAAAAVQAALDSPTAPTALVFDNDVMAVAALTVVHESGRSVPHDVSIIAWDDSLLCRVVTPRLTALAHDVGALGSHASRRLFDVIAGAGAESFQDPTPTLVVRGSTGPPPQTP